MPSEVQRGGAPLLPPPPDLFPIAEVAQRLRVSRGTVYNWINSGKLAAVDIGQGKTKTRVRAEDLDAFIEALPRKAPAA